MNIQKIRFLLLVFTMGLLAVGCKAKTLATDGGKAVTAASIEETSAVKAVKSETAEADTAASDTETISQIDVAQANMEPVYGTEIRDGVYSVTVDSSSSMFQITACELTVKDGMMDAVIAMSGTGYLKLYMGTREEALKADEKNYIPYIPTEEGTHTFKVPVKALDVGINCSAFSKNKENWYDRVLVFRSDSLPIDALAVGTITTADSLNLEDGIYTVEVILGGGSGRAFVETPASIRVEGRQAFATVIWSSSNYDYMKVDNEKYEWTGTEGNSTFEIPVYVFDRKIPVLADTIAMSEPHEIKYTLTFDSRTLKKAE